MESNNNGVVAAPQVIADEPEIEFLTLKDSLASETDANCLLINACKFGDIEHVKRAVSLGAEINKLHNGDYALCIAAHKGHKDIVEYLLENGADPNVRTDISTMRRVRRSVNFSDSPLSLAIKYGHNDIAVSIVNHGGQIFNNNEFEKSPLQEAIRLYRTDCLKALSAKINEQMDILLENKMEIFKQCLINDNVEAMKIFVPLLWNRDNLNSDFLMTAMTNLMLKNKVQTEKAVEVLEAVLESIPTPKFKLYDLAIFVKGFLRLLSAQFLSISDERLTLLLYRANLFFIVLKYHDRINFENYFKDLDFAFMTIFNSIKDTGESKVKAVEFMMNFYDNLIVMGHLVLTPDVINMLLQFSHVQELQKIQDYLLFRATGPFTLKEICRLQIKYALASYKRRNIDLLKVSDKIKDFLYFLT